MQLDEILSNYTPQKHTILAEGEGVLVWIHSPKQKLASLQMLAMYGGIEIISSNTDAVYFFRALSFVPFALLYKSIILRYEASVYVLPSTLYIEQDNSLHLQYQSGIKYVESSDASPSTNIEEKLYLHDSLVHVFSQQTGVSLVESQHEGWYKCEVHRNATIPQTLLWNVVIKSAIPITGEKKSSLLWQSTLQTIEEFLRNKRLQVAKHNSSFLQLVFSSQEQLRMFLFDYANFITVHTQEVGEDTFTATTVIATLQRNTSMFSANIDTYYTFNTAEVIFNHCHTTLYDALLINRDFEILPSSEQTSFDSWAVLLDKQELYKKDVQVLSPVSVSIGEKQCFYCGMRNHSSSDCPTHVFPWTQDLPYIWEKVGAYPFAELIELSKAMEHSFEDHISLQEMIELYSEDSPKGVFIQALFSIPLSLQLRSLPAILSRKLQDNHSYKRLNKQEAQIQYFNKRIMAKDFQQVEYELNELIQQSKEYRYYTFLGFINIEKGDYVKAINYWKEAQRLSYTPKLVVWHLHLQGRAYEVIGEYNNALSVYKQALQLDSNSKDVRYRYIVTLIQMGRVETAMKLLERHLQTAPEDFVKILFDVQARQGYLEITRLFSRMLEEYASRVEQVEKEMTSDSKNIEIWGRYDPTTFKTLYNDFNKHFEQRTKKDFLTYSVILEKYTQYEENLHKNITSAIECTMQRVERVFSKLLILREHLKAIPLRSQLQDFSRQLESNISALERMDRHSLERADYFEILVTKLDEIEDKMEEMEYSIYFMQMVRDSSLFMVLFLRNFIIIEIIVAILIVSGIPTLFYYATHIGFLSGGMPEFHIQWNLQKNTMIVATGIVFILVGSSTLLRFKKRKREIIMQFMEGTKS